MNCVKNWCWKSAWRTAEKAYVGKGAWWAALKTAEKVTEKVSFQGNKVTSLKLKRRQCRLQLGTAMNLALHISLQISAKSSHAWPHFDEMSLFVQFDVCWQNVAFYALWRILAKCCDLRTLPGTKFWLPGTFNYYAPLGGGLANYEISLSEKTDASELLEGGGVSELLIFFMPPLIGSLTPTRSTYTYQELLSSVFAHVSLETLSFSARIATLLTLAGIATLCATTRKTTSHERYS